MFNNKFNPDVVYSFENENKSRINTKYEIKNIPYKVITKENKLVKNQNDLKIPIKENKEEVNINFNKIIEERKIKLLKDKKNNFKELNNLSLDNNYINDFKDLRDESKSEYKDKEDDILKDREKYNNMIESLLNDGILG
jgi:hypothetical protein|tara:strand:+ start:1696 stop:2112 length:417 start_codon:yes stop_codon:yes gene_type:complete